jgi:hypothetical protein
MCKPQERLLAFLDANSFLFKTDKSNCALSLYHCIAVSFDPKFVTNEIANFTANLVSFLHLLLIK